MEAFSLLKYWRGGGGAAAVSAVSSTRSTVSTTTTILRSAVETDDDSGDDEGPFFDLEFTLPDEECDGEEDHRKNSRSTGGKYETDEEEEMEEEREFNFAVSSEASCRDLRADPNLSLSPSDDLFFKGRLVPLEPLFNSSEPNSKPNILPLSLLKSATKFRVFMLGLKKPKSAVATVGDLTNAAAPVVAPSPKQQQQRRQQSNKFFTVKFKVEEVPIVSLFTRDNSSRSSGSNSSRGTKKPAEDGGAATASAEEKKLSKEVVQKYLSKIKPLYVRVSKRYGEKLRFSGQLGSGGVAAKAPPPAAPVSTETEAETGETEAVSAKPAPTSSANLPSGLRVVCKHLGKSRSASSAVAAAPSAPPPALARRRDDSLLQQEDGIQSAIAHCKRSFNASSKEADSPLVRSKSDPCEGISVDHPTGTAAAGE